MAQCESSGSSPRGSTDGRPLWQLACGWWWAPWLVVAAVAMRLLAVGGMELEVYFDSAEYDIVDFSGRNRRPWATPLLFWLVPGDDGRLVVAQAVIGALCWAALALSAAAWFRLPSARLVVAVALIALGCTTAVTNWDTTKLSESLALSLTALVVAAWLNLLRRPAVGTGALVLLATVPWLFVRHGVLPSAGMVVAVALTGAAVSWRRGGATKVLGGVAIGLVVLVGVASLSYGRNQEIVQQNLRGIVANRVAPDPDRLAWFVDHGMPIPASGRLDQRSLLRDPAFTRWAAGEGQATYARYLVTHPRYSATGPIGDMVHVDRARRHGSEGQATTLSPAHNYGSARSVEPEQLEALLFDQGRTGTVSTALAVAVVWTVAGRRRRHRGWVVPTAVVAISCASLLISWNGSVPEQPRHAIVGAVGLRIGLVVQLALLAEADLLARRRRGSTPDEGPPPVDRPTRRPVTTTS